MEKFSAMPLREDTLFETHYREMGQSFKSLLESNPTPDVHAILESFDTAPYALDEKVVKSKSDISYIFSDEAGDRYRIQFLAAPKFGKGVVKVYIGKGKGARLFVDKVDRFANPKAMIATVINFFTEHLMSPEGMVLRGFIVDLSGAASIRSIPVLKKVIKSALVSKIKVADDTFQPQEGRKYLWVTKSTLKPADVFNGPGCEGAPWLQGKEKAGDQSTDKKGDSIGAKTAKFDPMLVAQTLINSVLPLLKKYNKLELKPSLNNQLKYVSVAVNVEGQPITHYPFGFEALKGGSYEPKKLAVELSGAIDSRMKQIADAQKKAKEESERAMNLKKDPAFYLKQQQAAIEGEINLKVKGFNFKLEFTSSGKLVKARALENGITPASFIEFTAPNAKEDDEEMRDFTVSQVVKMLRRSGYLNGRKSGIVPNQTVKVTNFSRYGRGFKTEGDVDYGVLTSAEETFGEVTISRNNAKHKVDWTDIVPHSGAADGGQTKTQTQTASGKVKVQKDPVIDQLVDYGFKDVKQVVGNKYQATTKTGIFVFEMEAKGMKPISVSSSDGAYTDRGPWGYDVLRAFQTGAYWLGSANRDMRELSNDIVRDLGNDLVAVNRSIKELGYKVGLFKTEANAGSKKEALQIEREFVSETGQVFKFHMFGVWKPQDSDMEVNVRFEKVGAGTFGGLQDTARVSGPTNTARPFVRIAGDLFDGFLAELKKVQSEPSPKATVKTPRGKKLRVYYTYPNGKWLAAATWDTTTQELSFSDGSGGGIDTNSLLSKVGGQSHSQSDNVLYIKNLMLNKYGSPSTSKGLAQGLKAATFLDWWVK